MTTIVIPGGEKYCEWCEVASAEIFVIYDEPIQLHLFHKTVVCQYLCVKCLKDAEIAEQYAKVS
jgi:hypothetical protein